MVGLLAMTYSRRDIYLLVEHISRAISPMETRKCFMSGWLDGDGMS